MNCDRRSYLQMKELTAYKENELWSIMCTLLGIDTK
jgi:hypothetical protein